MVPVSAGDATISGKGPEAAGWPVRSAQSGAPDAAGEPGGESGAGIGEGAAGACWVAVAPWEGDGGTEETGCAGLRVRSPTAAPGSAALGAMGARVSRSPWPLAAGMWGRG